MSDLQRILEWPAEMRLPGEDRALVERRSVVHAEIRDLIETAERYDRALTPEETERYNQLQTEFERITAALGD